MSAEAKTGTETETANETIIALRGMRGMIADKMLQSLATSAQLTHHASADLSALLAKKAAMAEAGQKVSVEDLMLHAVAAVLARHPGINGTLDGKEVRLSAQIDLSVAIALPDNLLVAPTIFDCASKSVAELRAARQDLAARAKANKLSVKEMTSGTFSVSNIGLSRVEHFTPILNTPQLGILGVGCARERAVRGADGAIAFKPYVGLSLTFDHRAVNGAPAADVLTDLCETLENLT